MPLHHGRIVVGMIVIVIVRMTTSVIRMVGQRLLGQAEAAAEEVDPVMATVTAISLVVMVVVLLVLEALLRGISRPLLHHRLLDRDMEGMEGIRDRRIAIRTRLSLRSRTWVHLQG